MEERRDISSLPRNYRKHLRLQDVLELIQFEYGRNSI
jgi:hypothetical protein